MLVIVNPTASNGSAGARWHALAPLVQQTWPDETIEIAQTTARGHATAIAAQAAGHARVLSVGGDGTINEVVNGLMSIAPDARPPLGLIPCGTGGDFARTFGLPTDANAAIAQLRGATPRPIDIGECAHMSGRALSTRYFANIAGLGFDAAVCAAVEAAALTGRKGKAVYFWSVFKTLTRLRQHTLKLRTTLDGATQELATGVCMAAVCNGRYFGGGMHVAPDARPDDGAFDVVIIGAMSAFEFARNFLRVYRGTHLSHPKVRVLRAQSLRIEAVPGDSPSVPLEAEGELLGAAPVSIRLLRGALRILTG